MRVVSRPVRLYCLLLMSIALLALPLSCANKEDKKKPKSPVPVRVTQAVVKDVPMSLHAIGNVEPFSTVAVKSLVPGTITSVNFTEGQDVRRGALLFTIDPRPLEADLHRVEGVLAKDTVEADNAESDARRYDDLFKKGAVSRQQYDLAVTTAASLRETLKTDRAAVESIKVQLGYTKIYSPLDGRTGNLNADKGNVVKAYDTLDLVVINQITPVHVTFTVPEKFLAEIQDLAKKGPLKVTARSNSDTAKFAEGRLAFIDNAVDPATGAIKLKATFPNSDRRLWPGQFVDVEVALTTLKGVTVVPNSAVLTGQKGLYVFVVKPDHTVEARPVVSGVSQAEETVLEQGIKPGETVVTDGQVKLAPGAAV